MDKALLGEGVENLDEGFLEERLHFMEFFVSVSSTLKTKEV